MEREKIKILSLGDGRRWDDWLYENEVYKLNQVVEFTATNEDLRDSDIEIDCVDQLYSQFGYAFLASNKKHENVTVQLYDKDIFEYLENYPKRDYDVISSNRIFEHVHYEKIPYLLYLLKQVCRNGAKLSFIVPDFELVFDEVVNINKHKNDASKFNKALLDVHTEIFNEKYDPHQSIWTKDLAEYYFGLENYWKMEYDSFENVNMDGRSWYMWGVCKKVDD